jgi:serralysin
MATFNFSVLSNNQAIAFDPLTDVLFFDTGSRPAELLINQTLGGVQFAVGGKSITLSGVTLDELGISTSTDKANVKFSVPGQLLVGEETTDTGGELGNNIKGGNGDDALLGLAGDDKLDGGAGGDLMIGGAGSDTYIVDNAADSVTETTTLGEIDQVLSSVTYTLTAFVENLTLTGAKNVGGNGNTLANEIVGNGGDNFIDGKTGADRMVGGDGNDTYFVDNIADTVIEANSDLAQIDTVNTTVNYILKPTLENLNMLGTSSISASGNNRVNVMTGNSGANSLNGQGGADRMTGGDGKDVYFVESAGDKVIETNADPLQIDTVASVIDRALEANVENLRLLGSANIDATGNGLNNVLFTNTGSNVIDGGAGNDTVSYADVSLLTLALALGNPATATITVGATGGVTVDLNISGKQDTTNSGLDTLIGIENVTGSKFNDTLTGDTGKNVLDGGGGSDLLIGGKGDDTFIVDGADEAVETNGSANGIDTVLASVSYRLSGSIERLTLTGSALNATGNDLANTLIGTTGTNTLDGRAGADKMTGGGGADTYVVDNLGDEITENLDSAIDQVNAFVNVTLGGTIENLRLMGHTSLNGTGNALNNKIYANDDDNVMDGGSSEDPEETDSDTVSYLFGATSGVTVDLSKAGFQNTGGSGTDKIGNFENLTGSAFDDLLSGNADSNILSGGEGSDTVSYAGANGGLTIDLHLGTVTGSDSDTLLEFENVVGGDFKDVLIGNLGDNVLDGGAGIDTVSYANVKFEEGGVKVSLALAGAQNTLVSGFDKLISIENLTGSVNGDLLSGNAKVNAIDGGEGDDSIAGGGDADALTGGAGNDLFIFASTGDSTSADRDSISDYEDGTDKIDVSAIDAKSSTTSDDSFTFRGTSAFNGAGQIRVEKSGTDTIVFFNTNSSDAPEMVIVLVNTAPGQLSAQDFIL